MDILVDTQAWNEVETDWLVVGVPETDGLAPQLATMDGILDGQLTRLRESEDLSGKLAEALVIHDVPQIVARRVLLVGLGKSEEFSLARLGKAMTTAARQMSSKADRSVAIVIDPGKAASGGREAGDSLADWGEIVAAAMHIGCVGQSLYRSESDRFEFREARIVVGEANDSPTLREAVTRGSVLGEATNVTRELVNRSASEIFPVSFAARAEQIATDLGIGCTILDEGQLRDERMNALLAVASGSAQPPRLVILEYCGAGKDVPTLGFVGKGVTFDSGGLSLKSSENMSTMKGDMAGAATVLGAMSAIARLELPVNVTGFMGLVENMPGGSSYKLGDVLTARNGVTIEVLNTDAEGRLLLADVLSYAVDHGVDRIVDLATLTGACVVALGEQVTGVFTNNQDWCNVVLAAAERCGEDVWQLPMFDHYAELIKSDVSDVKNVAGRWGGAITAAKFLEKFVGETPWVHLDIAGPSFVSNNKPHREGGATGCMLRTIVETAVRCSAAMK